MSKSTIFMFVVLSSTIAAIIGFSRPALAIADASQQEAEEKNVGFSYNFFEDLFVGSGRRG